MESEAETEGGAQQTSDDTESAEMKEEAAPRPDLDAPDSNLHGPTEEEEEEEKEEDEEEEEEDEEQREKRKQEFEEYMPKYRELVDEREKSTQHNVQLQVKLSDYFSKKADHERPEEEMSYEELLQEFTTSSKVQADLKKQLRSNVVLLQEKLDEVETERLALSRLRSNEEPHIRAQSALIDLQLQQVTELCRKNNRLRTRINRLVEQSSAGDKQAVDPLLLQFHHLQLARLEQERNTEKREKPAKLQAMFSTSLECLKSVKATLDVRQKEVQAKQGQLAELEATLDQKRTLLIRIRQSHEKLLRDNLRLKEQQGLLGNLDLLGYMENAMDYSGRLEERVPFLKSIHKAASDCIHSETQQDK